MPRSEIEGTDGLPESTRGDPLYPLSVMGGYKQAIPPKDSSGLPMEMDTISAGRYHTCASKKSDGMGVCWGRNDYYQADIPRTVMVGNIVRDMGPVTQIVAGTLHSCAATSANNFIKRGVCWGYNVNGQVLYPKAGLNLPWDAEDLQMIASGERHNCGIRTAGQTAFCWGWNHFKQSDPVPVGQIYQIGVGDLNSCAILATGQVKCWGSNSHGQSSPPAAAVLTSSCYGPMRI